MTTQYRESDLAFLKRLLAEEGLFCWFEHQADAGDTLGRHTLVIADANSAFTPNPQPRIRFTQAGATLAEDSLSGLKTQQLSTSKSWQGGFNQLVFDDTPGEARIELATTQYQSTLQLGHLKQQTDNARQADRGHGGELQTQASLALRAGNGLLLSADARPNPSSTHLDSREAIAISQLHNAKAVEKAG